MGVLGGRRKGTPVDTLVVGLGNPGDQYAHSRHNVGADAVRMLSGRLGDRLKLASRDRAEVALTRLGSGPAVLAVPATFMNESGDPVGRLWRRYELTDIGRLVVVHDELDLEPGRVKVKVGGGLAGHNGLRSIRDHLKTTDFTRVRIGVGKPPHPKAGADHVLKRVTGKARVELDISIEVAADAVEIIAERGAEAAMGEINGLGER